MLETYAVRDGTRFVSVRYNPAWGQVSTDARIGGRYVSTATPKGRAYVLSGAVSYRTLRELREEYPEAVRSPEWDRS